MNLHNTLNQMIKYMYKVKVFFLYCKVKKILLVKEKFLKFLDILFPNQADNFLNID